MKKGLTKRSSLFCLFAEYHQENTGGDDQDRADQRPNSHGFPENQHTDDHTGDGLQGAEDGYPFTADKEGAQLEQGHCAGGDQQRKQHTQPPAHGCAGQRKPVGAEADQEGHDAADQSRVKA